MRQEDVAKRNMLRQLRGTRLVVTSRQAATTLFVTESVAESDELCDLLEKLLEKRNDNTATPVGSTIFLTLLPHEASEGKRCAGIFSDVSKAASCLTQESTENGFYTLAVIEKVAEGGYWPTLEAVQWWSWTGSAWEEIPKPESLEKAKNFAIG